MIDRNLSINIIYVFLSEGAVLGGRLLHLALRVKICV